MVTGDRPEGSDIRRCPVGEGIGFEPGPEGLHRVELGSVGREEGGGPAAVIFEEAVHDFGPVGVRPVPDQEDGFSDVAAEVAQETKNAGRRDVGIGVHGEEHPHPASFRGDGQGGDDGYLFMGAADLLEDGGLAFGRPGAATDGSHHEAAFVDKNDVGVQVERFFFRSGQSVLTQRRMARSSRSRARRSGF